MIWTCGQFSFAFSSTKEEQQQFASTLESSFLESSVVESSIQPNGTSPRLKAPEPGAQRLLGALGKKVQLPLVMGIVNVTPDSFSDGGQFHHRDQAVRHALQLVEDGANILDIGGESSRPDAQPISWQEECDRVLPVLRILVPQISIPISIDTTKPETAERCLDLGASIVNDIRGFRDPALAQICLPYKPGLLIMHMQGNPLTMQNIPYYDQVVPETIDFLKNQIDRLLDSGFSLTQLAIDPGIGFGKSLDHNLTILRSLLDYQVLNRPLCLGVSRKSFLGRITDRDVHNRLPGSLAVICYAQMKHSAQIVRVHDVRETIDILKTIAAIENAN